MCKRRGLSMTEVLVAIFVMAIGMISLLVLFPVGLSNMAWAMRNNRMSQAVPIANSMAETPQIDPGTQTRYSLRDDPVIKQQLTQFYPQLFNGVNWLFNANNSPMVVFVDPVGYSALPALNDYVGGLTSLLNPPFPGGLGTLVGVPRVSMTPAMLAGNTSLSQSMNLSMIEDEIAFDPNGSARSNPLVYRERRYSWSYVVRWPQMSEPQVAEMQIVLYSGRPTPQQVGGGLLSTELAFLGGLPGFTAFQKGSTTAVIMRNLALPWPPPVKKGDWVFDNTVINLGPLLPLKANGYFYKIVAATETAPGLIMELQLDRPAKDDGVYAVFPKGVVDVIEKSDGRRPAR